MGLDQRSLVSMIMKQIKRDASSMGNRQCKYSHDEKPGKTSKDSTGLF